MKGIFQRFDVTHGSFGEQHTVIDGVTYLTWFDLVDPSLKGLGAGATVEFQVCPGPTVLCHLPHVESKLGSAKLVGVVKPSARTV